MNNKKVIFSYTENVTCSTCKENDLLFFIPIYEVTNKDKKRVNTLIYIIHYHAYEAKKKKADIVFFAL
jgi:hypothetical protein